MEWSLLYQFGIGVATVTGFYWIIKGRVDGHDDEFGRVWKRITELEEKLDDMMVLMQEIKESQIRTEMREKVRQELMEELKSATKQ